MKILVISSQYVTGGYGQLCEETSWHLAERGHSVYVLTCQGEKGRSRRGVEIRPILSRDPDWSSRWPGYVQFFLCRKTRERDSLKALEDVLLQFAPDVIFVWQGTGLPRSLLVAAEQRGYPVVCRLCDYWPSVPDEYWAYWEKPATRSPHNLLKRALAPLTLWILHWEGKPLSVDFDNAICVSHAVCHHLRQAGIPLRNAVTIYNGIELDDFLVDLDSLPYPRRGSGTLSLLYGGGLLHHKGVHVAIEAMHYLRDDLIDWHVTLTVIGDGPEAYVSFLHQQVHKWGLGEHVDFKKAVPREQMPGLLREYDVLVFPSLYEEPLARMMQEAMAAGLVVAGTTTGGSKEILEDGVNALAFRPGDAMALAAQIRRLTNTDLRRRLARAAQRTAITKCDITQTTEQVESYLRQVVSAHRGKTQ